MKDPPIEDKGGIYCAPAQQEEVERETFLHADRRRQQRRRRAVRVWQTDVINGQTNLPALPTRYIWRI